MGKIHVLSERVATRSPPAKWWSVLRRCEGVAGERTGRRFHAHSHTVEAGGKKLIQITDNGCGMVRDDAMLAFERHATSKIKNRRPAEHCDPRISRRGAALDRFRCPPASGDARRRRGGGTVLEINGGKIIRVEEAGLPLGTSITIRDLFFIRRRARNF